MSQPQDLTCLNFPGRVYGQKEVVATNNGRFPWGDPNNQDVDNPGVNFFKEWIAYQPYCHPQGGCSGSGCDCSPGTLANFGLSDTGGAVWKGMGNCSGGSDWGCCGCGIMSWNQSNKSQCCNPAGSPIQGSAIHCETGWCPFSPQCEQDQTTSDYCLKNIDDPNCLKICMNHNTKESVTNQTRPAFCDSFMGRYCVAHGNDSPMNQDLCSCLSANTSNAICVSYKCTNAANAWVTDQMYARQQNCGTICQQYINGETADGNVNISGNDFTIMCGNSGTSGKQSVPWWSYITGDGYVNSPGAPLPDINTKYWWGHWKQTTDSEGHVEFIPSFSPSVIIAFVIIGLTIMALLFFIIRRIWAAAAPPSPSTPSPSTPSPSTPSPSTPSPSSK
jgi:hypothetical protein